MKSLLAPSRAQLNATQGWSKRVRRVGGFIQVAFATFWLVRGSLNITGGIGLAIAVILGLIAVGVTVYGVRVTAGKAVRPMSVEGKRIEKEITIATVLQLIASFAAPAIVVALGYQDWLLPSIVITIGPLLLWLDQKVDIARLRPVGWLLILGPLVLIATMSGSALAATTGIASGFLLLGTAAAGFHDLSDHGALRARVAVGAR